MQKCKELCGQNMIPVIVYQLIAQTYINSTSQKTSSFFLVPSARNALWYIKHSDTGVIDSGCL